MNFDYLCRLCMNDSASYSDLREEAFSDYPSLLMEVVNNVCQLDILLDDGLPQFLCYKCYNKISEFQFFLRDVHRVNSVLLQMTDKTADDSAIPLPKSSLQQRNIPLKMSRATSLKLKNGDSLKNWKRLRPKVVCKPVEKKLTNYSNSFSSFSDSFVAAKQDLVESVNWSDSSRGICRNKKPVLIRNNRKMLKKVHQTVNKSPELDSFDNKRQNSDAMEKLETDTKNTNCFGCCMESIKLKKPKIVLDKRQKAEECHKSRKNILGGSKNVKQSVSHRKEQRYLCEICGKLLKNPSNRRSHMVTHSGVRPFGCDLCGEYFALKSTLKRHLLSHKCTDREYICKTCGKKYSNRINLGKHRRIHVDSDLPKCNICKKTFKTDYRLSLHIKTHNRSVHYRCNICQISFSTEQKHLLHMLKHEQQAASGIISTLALDNSHENLGKIMEIGKSGILASTPSSNQEELQANTTTKIAEKTNLGILENSCIISINEDIHENLGNITKIGKLGILASTPSSNQEELRVKTTTKIGEKSHLGKLENSCIISIKENFQENVGKKLDLTKYFTKSIHSNSVEFKNHLEIITQETYLPISHKVISESLNVRTEKQVMSTSSNGCNSNLKRCQEESSGVQGKLRTTEDVNLEIEKNSSQILENRLGNILAVQKSTVSTEHSSNSCKAVIICIPDILERTINLEDSLKNDEVTINLAEPNRSVSETNIFQIRRQFSDNTNPENDKRVVSEEIVGEVVGKAEKLFPATVLEQECLSLETSERSGETVEVIDDTGIPEELHETVAWFPVTKLVLDGQSGIQGNILEGNYVELDQRMHYTYENNILGSSEPTNASFVAPKSTEVMQIGKQGIESQEMAMKSDQNLDQDKPFKCDMCEKSFSFSWVLKEHQRCHSGETPFKCAVCQQAFSEKFILQAHIRKHVKQKSFQCEICGQEFRGNHSLKKHRESHQNSNSKDISVVKETKKVRQFKCSFCNAVLLSKKSLVSHRKTHGDLKPYECHICSKQYAEYLSLKSHRMTHLPEDLAHKCDHCDKSFPLITNLKRHQRSHSNSKEFQCHICDIRLSTKYSLDDHLNVHTGNRPHNCDICHMSFTSRHYLYSHKRTHTGLKPYQCNYCQKSFTQSASLMVHKRIHTGEAPIKCPFCDMSFRSYGSLRCHKETHFEDRNYKCDVCKKYFSRMDSLAKHRKIHVEGQNHKCGDCGLVFPTGYALKRHSRSHSGLKPYHCTICEARFSRVDNLKTHIKIHLK